MATITVPLPARVQSFIRTPEDQEIACDAAVRLLKAPGSLWPVATGRSKGAWRCVGSGFNRRVNNPVFYSSYVEAQNGRPARATLNAGASSIINAITAGRVRRSAA